MKVQEFLSYQANKTNTMVLNYSLTITFSKQGVTRRVQFLFIFLFL